MKLESHNFSKNNVQNSAVSNKNLLIETDEIEKLREQLVKANIKIQELKSDLFGHK